ncbi:putative leucine-rich repeat-containing protein DDB_G0290503 [Drosophila nasuta]|uniref:putative leucine-rich repeat-containing protein DDB_G0290503 n=1 Tax=Drosophila nasuta TaxID=42062 RepID=UPI00295E83B1|nr:putative leucine-rich repeat-containing protein DDB_G0290503 [Drosophila nasuta]
MVGNKVLTLIAIFAATKEIIAYHSSNKLKYHRKISVRSSLESKKYEYCVKIISVCYLLWDAPPDYEDENEDQDLENLEIDEQIRRAKCVPQHQSSQDNAIYWQNVRRWQREVEKLFLSTHMFEVIEELDGGNAIKINLWSLFHIKMMVICNRTRMINNVNSETDNCDENQEIGIWINEQVKCDTILEDFTNRVPNILNTLETHLYKDCCPYSILRDRLEVINDNIDTIMQLNSLEENGGFISTGNASIDMQNLVIRLEFINRKLISDKTSTQCCKNWAESEKSAKYRYQTEMNQLMDISSTSVTSNQSTEFYKNFNTNAEHLEIKILASENYHPQPNSNMTKNNCCSSKNQFKNIQMLVNEYIISTNFSKNPNDELRKSIENTKNIIRNSEILLNNELNQLNDLNSVCSDKCSKDPISKSTFQSKLRYLEDEVQQMMSSNINNLTIPNENDEIEQKEYTADEDELQNCLDSVERQKADMRQLIAVYNANMESHREIKKDRENVIKDLRNKLNKLRLANSNQSNKLEDNNAKERLEKRLKDIRPILDEKTQTVHRQSEMLNEIQSKLSENYTNSKRLVDKVKSTNFEINNKIEGQLNELEHKLNSTNLQKIKNSKKLDYLEARLKSMKNQSQNSIQRLLATIDALENRLKEVNNEIKESKDKAKKCSESCDLGKLPNIEQLQNRLNVLEKTLK